MTIQNAKHLFEIIRLGYSIGAKNGVITISPAHSIDEEMANLVRIYKADLLELLEDIVT